MGEGAVCLPEYMSEMTYSLGLKFSFWLIFLVGFFLTPVLLGDRITVASLI